MDKIKTYGIVGHPVKNSLSPAMHNAAIKYLELPAKYHLIDIDPKDPEELANFCYESELNNIGGFSVTMPYKEEIMAFMDHYDPLAKIVGSVNTVVNEDNKLIGYNTDATGAMQALKEVTEPMGAKALVLGAGGAARAITYVLREFGAEVYIYNRTQEKAEELAKGLEVEWIDRDQIPNAQFDIIVNCTPVGSLPNTGFSILRAEDIKAGSVVMDIITYPLETQLLKEAKKAGAKTITGERMLLHQAIGQFELWFDKEAPVKVMEEALYQELKKRK